MGGREELARSGSFVARDERERLLVALAELVRDQGYERTTLTEIVERAGVGPETFERHFDSKQDCLLAAYEAAARQAYAATAEAFVGARGGWPEAVREALARLLGCLADTPAFTHLCTVEALHAGRQAVERRDRELERFYDFLDPGFGVGPGTEPAPIVSETITASVFELIRSHAGEGRIEALPDALPVATILTLSPFLGSDEAARLAAQLPSGSRSGG